MLKQSMEKISKTLIWCGVKLIKAYQLLLRPLWGQRCKYYPSCSEYTEQAIRKKGFFVGCILGLWRIIRCNPWSLGGYDPVVKETSLTK